MSRIGLIFNDARVFRRVVCEVQRVNVATSMAARSNVSLRERRIVGGTSTQRVVTPQIHKIDANNRETPRRKRGKLMLDSY